MVASLALWWSRGVSNEDGKSTRYQIITKQVHISQGEMDVCLPVCNILMANKSNAYKFFIYDISDSHMLIVKRRTTRVEICKALSCYETNNGNLSHVIITYLISQIFECWKVNDWASHDKMSLIFFTETAIFTPRGKYSLTNTENNMCLN